MHDWSSGWFQQGPSSRMIHEGPSSVILRAESSSTKQSFLVTSVGTTQVTSPPQYEATFVEGGTSSGSVTGIGYLLPFPSLRNAIDDLRVLMAGKPQVTRTTRDTVLSLLAPVMQSVAGCSQSGRRRPRGCRRCDAELRSSELECQWP